MCAGSPDSCHASTGKLSAVPLLLLIVHSSAAFVPADACPVGVLQLEIVISFCCDFLFSWLDESNILEVHHLADVYGLQQLNARVHSYILRNIQTFSQSEVYRRLPQEEVFRALSSDELQVNSENEVYEAALHYHYSPEQVETDQVYLQVSPQVCLRFIHPVQIHITDKERSHCY